MLRIRICISLDQAVSPLVDNIRTTMCLALVSPCQDIANERRNLVASVGFGVEEKALRKRRSRHNLSTETKLGVKIDKVNAKWHQL